MLTTIFNGIGNAVTGFLSVISSAVTGVGNMFITQSEGTYTLTFLGTLLLIAAGVGLVYWGFRLIKGLVQRA